MKPWLVLKRYWELTHFSHPPNQLFLFVCCTDQLAGVTDFAPAFSNLGPSGRVDFAFLETGEAADDTADCVIPQTPHHPSPRIFETKQKSTHGVPNFLSYFQASTLSLSCAGPKCRKGQRCLFSRIFVQSVTQIKLK